MQPFVAPRNLEEHIPKHHVAKPSKELKKEIQDFEELESSQVLDELPEPDDSKVETPPPPPKRTRGVRGGGRQPVKKQRFECDRCGKYLFSQQAMRIHIRMHLKKGSFFCDTCGADYYTRNGLTKHVCREKRRQRPEVDHRTRDHRYCRFCDTHFKDLDAKQAHTCEKEDPTDKKWVFCRCCNKRVKKDRFNRHMEYHSEVEWRCSICDRKVATERALKLHMTTHSGNKPHQCKECPESFVIIANLRRHMQVHHGVVVEEFKCGICSKELSSRIRLRAHLNRVHSKQIFCELCKEELPSKAELKLHLMNGHDPPECEVCGKMFLLPRYLTLHRKLHTEKHLNRGPVVKTTCELCKLTLPSKEELKLHIESEHEPSVCQICNKSFALPRYLKMHEKLHVGNPTPNVQCSICFKMLSEKNIKPHVYRNHNDQFVSWKNQNPMF